MTPDECRAHLFRRAGSADDARVALLARIDRALDTMATDLAAGDADGRAERPTTARAYAAALLKRACEALGRLEER